MRMAAFIDSFHRVDGDYVRVAPEQASRFAKELADDFNPIHDPDAQRFCVPGDLLFALVVSRYGLHERMSFTFTGMVGGNLGLIFPETDAAAFDIIGEKGKTYLKVTREGEHSKDPALIESLIRHYVAFSGHNFPDNLVSLMEDHQVMINPARPLVIYESMSFDLHGLDFTKVDLTLSSRTLAPKGKRGDAELHFDFMVDGQGVGTGFKKLLLGGLMPYDQSAIDKMCQRYQERKDTLK